MKRLIKPVMLCFTILLAVSFTAVCAQTDEDAIMMAKKNLCLGAMYGYSSFSNYWEGELKRNNLNMGTVSSQMVSLMGTYGITDNLNVVLNLPPYMSTNATAGTLHGQHGFQDASLWLKWMFLEKDLGKGTFSAYAVGGTSTPSSNYIADYLPLAIGLHSTTLSGRIIADYQLGKFFATGSGTYTYRNNITIDQNAYYTTSLHLTNQVEMPDMMTEQFRTGYRSSHLIAEAIVTDMQTLGGFDIRRNDMPFPSNKMNSTNVGVNVKWTLKWVSGLSLIGNGSYTVTGRNVGQSTMIGGGVFYILDFNSKKSAAHTSNQK